MQYTVQIEWLCTLAALPRDGHVYARIKESVYASLAPVELVREHWGKIYCGWAPAPLLAERELFADVD